MNTAETVQHAAPFDSKGANTSAGRFHSLRIPLRTEETMPGNLQGAGKGKAGDGEVTTGGPPGC